MKNIIFFLFFCVGINAQDIVIVDYSEPMDSAGLFEPENYEIKKFMLSSVDVYVPEVTSVLKPAELPYDSLVYVYCVTGEHNTGAYFIRVTNVYDLAGNEINAVKNYARYSEW